MVCPNRQCLTKIADNFPEPDCPQCGCHLFPTRAFDQRERVNDRPLSESPGAKANFVLGVRNGRVTLVRAAA